MAIILNIDTAVESASVCLATKAKSIQFAINSTQKDHASWLHPAIQKLISKTELNLRDIEAIAITIGPGSYTGLRVGLAAAKGLCFALNIPLIAINTLEMMAAAIIDTEGDFICPLIDARRMEVFMAVYNKQRQEIIKPCAMIIEQGSFSSLLSLGKIIFSGNGNTKLKNIIVHPNAIFTNAKANASDMVYISEKKFVEKKFVDIVYAEPFYIKEFYSAEKG
ncbi:MAG: tRNA (adenosine(37)-N6)-threonylcarbamoyltransferase complex dimerization subunit type 1 TsaB [Chitinophagaceae bacterium]